MFTKTRSACAVMGRGGVLVSAVVLGLAGYAFAQPFPSLSVPFGDGTALTFVETGTFSNSDGGAGSHGPLVFTFEISAVDLQIFDHRATLASVEPGYSLPDNGSSYYIVNTDGVFIVSDNNPNLGQWYEYYTDPKPFLPSAPIDPANPLHFSGNWRGQWDIPQQFGGGYEPWTGTWAVDYFNDGVETITTPLGTFNAVHFREIETTTKTPLSNPNHFNTSTNRSDFWIADGMHILRVADQYYYESDFNGDSVIDYSETENNVLTALSFTGQTITMPAPMLAPPAYNSAGGATQQAVTDALDAVNVTTRTSPLGDPVHQGGGIGFVSEIVQLDDTAVADFIAALQADGASAAEAFLRVELPYDEASLASFGINESDIAPYWWDEDIDQWLLVGTTTAGTRGAGALATLPQHEGLVGYYGVDTVNDLVWMNVNHASIYGVLTPEPATAAVLSLSALVMVNRRRRPGLPG